MKVMEPERKRVNFALDTPSSSRVPQDSRQHQTPSQLQPQALATLRSPRGNPKRTTPFDLYLRNHVNNRTPGSSWGLARTIFIVAEFLGSSFLYLLFLVNSIGEAAVLGTGTTIILELLWLVFRAGAPNRDVTPAFNVTSQGPKPPSAVFPFGQGASSIMTKSLAVGSTPNSKTADASPAALGRGFGVSPQDPVRISNLFTPAKNISSPIEVRYDSNVFATPNAGIPSSSPASSTSLAQGVRPYMPSPLPVKHESRTSDQQGAVPSSSMNTNTPMRSPGGMNGLITPGPLPSPTSAAAAAAMSGSNGKSLPKPSAVASKYSDSWTKVLTESAVEFLRRWFVVHVLQPFLKVEEMNRKQIVDFQVIFPLSGGVANMSLAFPNALSSPVQQQQTQLGQSAMSIPVPASTVPASSFSCQDLLLMCQRLPITQSQDALNIMLKRKALNRYLSVPNYPRAMDYCLDRIKQWCSDSYMGSYRWDSGSETWRGRSFNLYGMELPTDSELLITVFGAFFDERMPLVNIGRQDGMECGAFTSRYISMSPMGSLLNMNNNHERCEVCENWSRMMNRLDTGPAAIPTSLLGSSGPVNASISVPNSFTSSTLSSHYYQDFLYHLQTTQHHMNNIEHWKYKAGVILVQLSYRPPYFTVIAPNGVYLSIPYGRNNTFFSIIVLLYLIKAEYDGYIANGGSLFLGDKSMNNLLHVLQMY